MRCDPVLFFGITFALAASPHLASAQNASKPGRTPVSVASSLIGRSHTSGKSGAAALVPLNPRERVQQLLNRFTFGARPGEVDRVLALGADAWLEQQLTPDAIKDAAWSRRQSDWPTLAMSSQQALALYPDRSAIQRVLDGKQPMPSDPQLAAVYDVQLTKLRAEKALRTPDANGNLPPEPTDAEKEAAKQTGQATADRIAGQLLVLPKKDRMATLLALPVNDRIAFAQYLSSEPRTLLFTDFTPRERELFNDMAADIGAPYRIGEELAQAKLVRAILTERQLQEVMTDFWFNHFNVYVPKDSDQWYTTAYERDAIRKNALGHFSDLLLATAQHPAMLVYLDNWLSIGPDSLANGVNPANPKSKPGNRGLNENYGREVMELHTVGVNGGYTQADVTALSAVLTGWTVNDPGAAGPFQFDPKRHEPGTKVWLGRTFGSGPEFVPAGSASIPLPDVHDSHNGASASVAPPSPGFATAPAGMQEGLAALTLLARSPQTAHFISWKLAQRFVADDPPPALVDRLAATFLSSDGDIKIVLRALIHSPEFNSRRYFRNKVKTPVEFLASAFRATATEPSNPGALVNTLRSMGMEPYRALPPTGYYLTAEHWMNSTALVDRLNFADQLTSGRYGGQRFDAAHGIGLALGPLTPTQPAVPISILESTMIGAPVSPQTNTAIHTQLMAANTAGTTPADVLNLIAGLLLGSPEFQLH